MSILGLVIILCALGGLLWLVKWLFPGMNPVIFKIITVVVIVIAILITLNAFGVWDEIRGARVPKI